MANPLKGEVIRLYKTLLYLGREYPQGSAYFRDRLKSAFMKNKDVTDPEKVKKLVARGEFVIKELEALYFLRKYRAMKQRFSSRKVTRHFIGVWIMTIAKKLQLIIKKQTYT
uniref:LYR motif containing 5a n=1 Tax=Seriola dumerili TaxID=41447 RepID=A0A3B4UK09_SERDU